MTEEEWLACEEPYKLFRFQQARAGVRKLRLCGVACCRRVWSLLPHEGSQRAIEAAELFSDGAIPKDAMAAARSEAVRVVNHFVLFPRTSEMNRAVRAAEAARCVTCPAGKRHVLVSEIMEALNSSYRAEVLWKTGYQSALDLPECLSPYSNILRDIIGNPFRRVSCDPAWLAWNGGTIPTLAQAVYEERELPSGHLDPVRLALLADMLEDAGCSDMAILDHLRGPGPHVRGCWVVDLLLGKS